MNKILIMLGGIAVLLGVLFSYSYWSVKEGRKQDQLACRILTQQQVVDAVINDVVDPENKVFSKYNLVRGDIIVNVADVHIEESMAYVPFTLRKNLTLKYVAMPRCSVLSNIEYSKN